MARPPCPSRSSGTLVRLCERSDKQSSAVYFPPPPAGKNYTTTEMAMSDAAYLYTPGGCGLAATREARRQMGTEIQLKVDEGRARRRVAGYPREE